MLLRRLVFTLAVSASAVVITASQATPATSLSEALRGHLKSERFQIVTSLRGLPLGVRDALMTLFGGGLDIADSASPVQGSGSSNQASRRLVAAGCSMDHCLVYYEIGAGGGWKVALFHWTPAETQFEFGGTAPVGLKTVDDARNAVLTGAVKTADRVW